MIRTIKRPGARVLVLTLIVFSVGALAAVAQNSVPAEAKAALDRISADSLRGHLSFIASDLLEGRATPSRGLDTAALYIAAQFRRAGLEPAGDDGYFQTANWVTLQHDMDAFNLKLRDGKEMIDVRSDKVSFAYEGGVNVDRAPLYKIVFSDAEAVAALKPDELKGRVVLTEIPDYRREDRARRMEAFRARNEFLSRLSVLKAEVILTIDRSAASGSGSGQGRLIDPENRRTFPAPGVPLITVHDQRVAKLYDEMKSGSSAAEVSLKLAPPVEKPVKIRNVIGVLRGSDPALKDTYVLVTAHYDHLGVQAGVEGDNIFNGANDDGSGTVSVVELASALAAMNPRPKRSLVFMTFFGEERGLLGSRYYGAHPVFPIEKTVADINLEQVGRTDSTEGPQVANASMTGFDFSDVGEIFKAAGEQTGIKVYKHERNSDAYFSRSDNQALADQGVPAHTLCVAYDYPDYHGAGDHWEKIDYDNMARVDRMVALGLLMIANNPAVPKWNEANAKTARYVKAWKERHGASSVPASQK